MNLPIIDVSILNTIYAPEEDGKLIYKYSPLQNKKIILNDGSSELTDLTLAANTAKININNPVHLNTEVSYDGSVNVILNDHTNPLKIINSRFYLVNSDTYKIADRKGNVDTNIYTENNFQIEASLIKTVRTVVKLDFIGIFDGGRMPVGSYNFYFKLADSDGNESDFISESGKVVCHIGAINNPKSIRGGQLDENSEKLIKFKLNNLDLAYNYINVYYTKTSGDDKLETLKTYKIIDKFRINGTSTEISITGYENHEEIDLSEINVQYANFTSAETNTNCQNMTFVGGITKNYELFKILEKYSLFITPELVDQERENIGFLNNRYEENYSYDDGYEYYNTKNIYYKLGYWDTDIYRFGIVYIMNDYTLSPVFNTRGIKSLKYLNNLIGQFQQLELDKDVDIGEDYILQKSISLENPENSKGVFKIDFNNKIFDGNNPVKPICLRFNFEKYNVDSLNPASEEVSVINGYKSKGIPGLKDLTKGFFIVRQKRTPTLLTQGLGIATSTKGYVPVINGTFTGEEITSNKYFTESFLKLSDENSKPQLGRSLFEVTDVKNNALLVPEVNVRPYIFNNLFNSSEFTLQKCNHNPMFNNFSDVDGNRTLFVLGNLVYNGVQNNTYFPSNLLLVEPGIDLIYNNETKFSSKAGTAEIAWQHTDPVLGDLSLLRTDAEISNKEWSEAVTKVRGEFNSYVGTSTDNLEFGKYYNIYQKNYNFESSWRNYFRVRYNDSSSFMAVSDRYEWSDLIIGKSGKQSTKNIYRGDCYINTYSHRMMWNFIDPELPGNSQIIDPYTWYKNYRVTQTKLRLGDTGVIVDSTDGDIIAGTEVASYKKVLDLFTWKVLNEDENSKSINLASLTMPDSKHFKKYSEANGEFGSSKIDRPDVNAVGLGHWVSFKICSNVNLAMRDVDFSRPAEEAIHKAKRSFYPLQSAKSNNRLPESNVINRGISTSLGNKFYFEIPDVPFIKTNFSSRIHYSDVLQESTFMNGNRIFKSRNYQDYSLEYGSLIKLEEWYGRLIAIMEHGLLMIPVNERAMMANEQGENVYINTDNVLPKNPRVISNTYGSLWAESVVKTSKFIYGIDTVAKKIWRTDGESFEIISDLKIQKFLNDNIKLRITDRNKTVSEYVIKSHYNAFKQDVMFVYIYDNKKWHLCWNELQNKWVTQYSWFPEFSENINNIFYTFANNKNHIDKGHILYKHGFAGSLEEEGNILPTFWYDEQHPFEYEFIVVGIPGIQKIFNNLKIISNWAEPDSFEFEVVGEGFDWNTQKSQILSLTPSEDIGDINTIKNQLITNYTNYLTTNTNVKKIPFIWCRNTNLFSEYWPDGNVIKDFSIYEHNKTKEKLITIYQKGADIDSGIDPNGRRYARLRGNMQYVEDAWDVQIQPITFKYAYLSSGNLAYSNSTEMKIRDKYLKVRIKYNGEKYAIINAIKTLFTLSYA